MRVKGSAAERVIDGARTQVCCKGNHNPPQSSSQQKIVNIKKGEFMNNAIQKVDSQEMTAIESTVIQGDLSKLSPQQRLHYYHSVCKSLGLNPLTKPFEYIILNGKLTLYARKDATEQLRKINGISIEGLEWRIVDDLYIVKAKAKDKHGRSDESTGAVCIAGLSGEKKANAIMKAETKAKRRVTLSIAGMGWVDESEVEAIPGAQKIDVDAETGEIKDPNEPRIVQVERPKITVKQADELKMIISECDIAYQNWFLDYTKKHYNATHYTDLPADIYEQAKQSALNNMHEHHRKQKEAFEKAQQEKLKQASEELDLQEQAE